MNILLLDKIQKSDAPAALKTGALSDKYAAATEIPIVLDEAGAVNSVGVGYTDATEIEVDPQLTGSEVIYHFDSNLDDATGNEYDGVGVNITYDAGDVAAIFASNSQVTVPDHAGAFFASGGTTWALFISYKPTSNSTLFDNGNLKIAQISSTVTEITIRGRANWIDVPASSDYRKIIIEYDGTNVNAYIDNIEPVMKTQYYLIDTDGNNILDTDGNRIVANYKYWEAP